MKNKKLLTAFLLLGCLFSTSCNMDSISNNSNINSSINLEKYKEVLEELGISNFENITIKEYLKEGSKYILSNKLSNAGYNKKIVVYQNNKLVGSMYDGVVNGYGGPIHFQLFFKGEVCKSFRCLSHTETPGFGKNLLEKIPNILIGKSIDYFEKNKLDSDFGSGSTITKTPLIASICEAAIDYKTVLEEKNNFGDDKFNDNSSNSSSSSNKEQSYEETLFGIDGASYEKVTLGALDENSNIKNVYIASVNDVETAICYELSGTTTLHTGYSEAAINGTLGVSFNISDDKVLTANAIDLGTANKFKDAANTLLSSFVGLDASVISEMTSASHEGIDFIVGSTVSSSTVFNLVVEAAQQYVNIDKSYLR